MSSPLSSSWLVPGESIPETRDPRPETRSAGSPLFALDLARFSFDVGAKLLKARVRITNTEALADDVAPLFVVNRLTRLEALLLPYVFHRQLAREVCPLVEGHLVCGRIGTFLRTHCVTAAETSVRDPMLLRALLEGGRSWMIAGEAPLKHTPSAHTGAAALALRAELHRRHVARLKTQDPEALAPFLQSCGLTSAEAVLEKRTVIVPVNVTYFPDRSFDNVFLRFACAVARDPSKRAIEEMSVAGTALAADSDVSIALGAPIDVGQCLDLPEHRALQDCDLGDLAILEKAPTSRFQEAAHALTLAYAQAIPRLTTINSDHILASLLRHQWGNAFEERAFRERAFLAAHHVRCAHAGPFHPDFHAIHRDIVREEPNARYDAFLAACIEAGVLEKHQTRYRWSNALGGAARNAWSAEQNVRARANAYAIEPLTAVTDQIKKVARTPARLNAYFVRALLVDEDRRTFDADYGAHYESGVSKPPEVGRPFLLKPFWRVKGGVVLIHGYMAAPLEMRAMAEHLRRNGYAVYAVRLKGHGTSPADLAGTTWEDWCESIERGCAILRTITDTLIIGGFSMGAGLALLTAARMRSRLSAVFAINAPLYLRSSAARLAPSIVRVNALLKRIHWPRARWEYVDNDAENKDINYAANPIAGVAELTKAMNLMIESVPNVTAPTLILQGSRDPTVSAESGPAIFEKVGAPEKALTVLERDRHGIINGPGADAVFDHVCRFLAQVRHIR